MFNLQVKFAVFVKLARAVGVPFVVLIVGLYVLFETAAVLANVWLKEWTDDPGLANLTALPANSSQRARRNDLYVGVYGALGVAQSMRVLIHIVHTTHLLLTVILCFVNTIIKNVLKHSTHGCVGIRRSSKPINMI